GRRRVRYHRRAGHPALWSSAGARRTDRLRRLPLHRACRQWPRHPPVARDPLERGISLLATLPPRLRFWLSSLIAVVAGLSYPLAFAPYYLVALLLVSLALLWWLLHDADSRTSLRIGYAFGLGQF